ncbi:hypothetical protein [Catellatospora vulcania]|uniref:hypothetical protein n=1 Tax=Catellatospora vulcania TaxID=1460450 RepID=UPI0012D4BAA6|nr:hypothetical protein [Catellatospora vulcania]
MITAEHAGKRDPRTAPAARRPAATGLARHAVFNGAWTTACCASVHTGPGCTPMSLTPND